ncbi:MAG: heme o synthase [Limnohabitans sp.]|nr:heme o synthase [Limnohabitans sp.]
MNQNNNSSGNLSSIFTDFKEITKAGLAISVVFSSLCGYLLGIYEFNSQTLTTLVLLAIGGYCMVGASNAYNQIIEKELDVLMDRTKNRPIPSGRMTPKKAFVIATALTIAGLVILYIINPKSAMFGAISIFLYTCIYTPLKTQTPLSVFVGAFPGAIPFMLGWVAATNDFGIEAGTLFIIQFFWQFPHFWAIGWFLFEDYKKGGFFMLPTGERNKGTAMQTLLYTVWLVVASVLPSFGFTGRLYLTPLSAIIILAIGCWMFYAATNLYKKQDDKSAKTLMLVSVAYISLIQVVYVLDKFLR